MVRSFLRLVLVALVPASSALAHQTCSSPCRPYVVEEICDARDTNCRAHMLYAPGQNMADNPAQTYWYAAPRQYADRQR